MAVLGEGRKEAKIWLIGEAPGAQEELQGRPFVGGAGDKLNYLLSKAGIARDACYIDNVVNVRPPNNNFGIYYSDSKRTKPTERLLEAHRKLQGLVREYKPNVVIALGNEPMYALTGKKQILKWRGSILQSYGVKVIPTTHPSAVLREPELEPIAVMDFKRIAEEIHSPLMPMVYNDHFTINPSFETIMHFLTKELPTKQIVAFDIETRVDLEQIVCIGFSWGIDEAICIPIFYGQQSWWTEVEEIAIIKAVKEAFTLPIKWIAQNAQYDLTYLMDKWDVKFPTIWMDTMIAFHTVYPELKKSLAFLTSIYTKRPYYKDDGVFGTTPDEHWTYNCKDCAVTYECALEIRKELEEFGTLEFYTNHPNKLIEPMMEMQRRGALIDVERRAELDKELSAKELELQERLDKAVSYPLNVNSPKQVKKFLYEDLGLPPLYKWGKKNGVKVKVLSADEKAIVELQKMTNNPVLALILEIRGIRKLLGTYIRAELEKNNRICCSYFITGTETGRLSSKKSAYDRGTNLQNIPREPSIRSMFIAEPGKLLVNADLSQAEARIVAYLSGEDRMQSIFSSGGDVHIRNASNIFGIRETDVSSSQRDIAKSLVHGANYCIGHIKFAKIVGVSEDRARELLNQYHAFYPSLQLWHKAVREQLGATRVLSTPLGRKRIFFGRWSEDLVREAIAYVPQSTVGDLLNLGIIRSWKALPPEWTFILQNHDSILASVPEETPHMHIVKFFRHYFEIPIEINRKFCKVPMDIKIGKNWGEMHKVEI